MSGRIAAFILAIACPLLLPGALAAQEAPGVEDSQMGIIQYEDPAESTLPVGEELQQLKQRVEELETSRTAHEDATRSIIRESISTLGSKINEFVTLGGTFEALAGRGEDFEGKPERLIRLNTAEIDFEIQVNDWAIGSIIFAYDDGSNFLFPTTDGDPRSVDKVNVDTAFVTLGDTTRFWPYTRVGRMIVPFGISTGAPVADVLTIENPLTIEAFETREDAVLIGVEFPTPPRAPLTLVPAPPPVRPRVLAPFVGWLGRNLGYRPPPKPRVPAAPVSLPPPAPPFRAGLYVYDGDTSETTPHRGVKVTKHFGATLGFRKRVNCRAYLGRQWMLEDEPRPSFLHALCPLSVDVAVDFNRSIFDSSFLEFEYRNFLHQIEFVPGMAASVKATLGPVSAVVEWNGAIADATFVDDAFVDRRIRPSAWQISLGYQFDWNPWIDNIGAQGTYLALGYSQSDDLEGATALFAGGASRVGTVPKRRFIVSAGEWVLDGVRIALEYAHVEDYARSKGGTGKSSSGVFSMFTYEW